MGMGTPCTAKKSVIYDHGDTLKCQKAPYIWAWGHFPRQKASFKPKITNFCSIYQFLYHSSTKLIFGIKFPQLMRKLPVFVSKKAVLPHLKSSKNPFAQMEINESGAYWARLLISLQKRQNRQNFFFD